MDEAAIKSGVAAVAAMFQGAAPPMARGAAESRWKRPAQETYRIADVARLLGISRNETYEAAHRGDFPIVRIGKLLLVPRAPIHRMLGL